MLRSFCTGLPPYCSQHHVSLFLGKGSWIFTTLLLAPYLTQRMAVHLANGQFEFEVRRVRVEGIRNSSRLQ